MLEHMDGAGNGNEARTGRNIPSARAYSRYAAIPLAPARNQVLTRKGEDGEIQAKADEPTRAGASAEESPESTEQMDSEEIAERVYRLMQRDLLVEKDRCGRFGG